MVLSDEKKLYNSFLLWCYQMQKLLTKIMGEVAQSVIKKKSAQKILLSQNTL